jgi:hypothetical protein
MYSKTKTAAEWEKIDEEIIEYQLVMKSKCPNCGLMSLISFEEVDYCEECPYAFRYPNGPMSKEDEESLNLGWYGDE